MPKYKVLLDSLETADDQISIKKPKEGRNYVNVGFLDNGVKDIPKLKQWIKGYYSPYVESDLSNDYETAVGSVALYGDLLEGNNYVGNNDFYIINTPIVPSGENIDEDTLIENIYNAIKIYHENTRIWNLSVSINSEISDEMFSDFAIALDYIQDKFKVLIIKSAGNCTNYIKNKEVGKIFKGADSVRALVVGSIAHNHNIYSLVEKGNPSPFSRIGYGPSFIVKPELTHYGGNIDFKDNDYLQNGIKVINKNGIISKVVGTSFSTPRITSLIAGLYQEINRDFDDILLKALAVHSSKYPDNLKIDESERNKYVGYGIPEDVRSILYNNPNEITLIMRDKIYHKEFIQILDFPMPDCLIEEGIYTGQIIATVIARTILDETQGSEYFQSNIELSLGTYENKKVRDTSKKNIINPVGKSEDSLNVFLRNNYTKKTIIGDEFLLKEKTLIQYKGKYFPIKKYAVDLSKLMPKNKEKITKDYNWFLELKVNYRNHIENLYKKNGKTLFQDFCVIITIKDPNKTKNVYDSTIQKLKEFNFFHYNIDLNNRLKVNN